MGPDEFHDGYPGRAGRGVRNNAYTNILLAWILRRSIGPPGSAGPRRRRPGHPPASASARDELERWDRLTRRLRVPFHADGVISQFEGYEQLAEFDWDGYRARYGDIGRLDLILAAEGDTPNHYRVSKQPDVLMLLLPALGRGPSRHCSSGSDYPLDKAAVRRTVDFYLAPHQPRLDPEPSRLLLAAGPGRPDPVVVAVQRGAGQRPRRHPARHDARGHPSRRHGRHRRPAAALLHGAGDPRRDALAAPGPAARARPRALRDRLPLGTTSS